MDVDGITYNDLVSKEELDGLEKELNKLLPKETHWTRSDYIAVFIAASVGACADIILGNRDNKFTGEDSKFSKALNKLHKHKGGAPIDYQGAHFGGGYHRELSRGHDLTRFVSGIKEFKNGTFEGTWYENGVKHVVKSAVNQNGNAYATLPLITAILRYARHMFADFFSTYSLPFPGYSFLTESNSRELRKFAADMYQNGFNCKNVAIQSVSTIATEFIVRLYFSIESVRHYGEDVEIDEDYSNINVINQFIKPEQKSKLHEMLLLAHTLVTAINIGKVTIMKKPQDINVTEITSVVRYGISVLKEVVKLNNKVKKAIYYAEKVNENWDNILDLEDEDIKKEVVRRKEIRIA